MTRLAEPDERALAARLIEAYDSARRVDPLTKGRPDLDVEAAYGVLARIDSIRRAEGWRAVGRKIGFTNTTIWERYGVYQPMWAHVWSHTVHFAPEGHATLSLAPFVQPRIEPEVVFGLRTPPAPGGDVRDLLACIGWMAPGFEIVQSHFPDWRFTAADCTAAFGLHGALVVGERIDIADVDRDAIAERLPRFALTLCRGHEVVERGVGANVLGGPLHALGHLVAVLAGQPDAPALAAGEIVTTGTVTDAWPVAPGETWSSDYGELGLAGLMLTLQH